MSVAGHKSQAHKSLETPELGSEASLAAPLGPPRHLPVRLGGPHAAVRGQLTRGVPGGHGGPEEGQEPA